MALYSAAAQNNKQYHGDPVHKLSFHSTIYAMTYPILVCLETFIVPLPLQQPVAGRSQGAVPRGARRGHTKAVGLDLCH